MLWCWDCLKKLLSAQLLKNFFSLHRIQTFISLITTAHHLSLYRIQELCFSFSILNVKMYLNIILITKSNFPFQSFNIPPPYVVFPFLIILLPLIGQLYEFEINFLLLCEKCARILCSFSNISNSVRKTSTLYLMQRCKQYAGTLKHFPSCPSMRFSHTQATSSPLKSKNVSTAMTALIMIIELHSLTD